jgi:adenylate cyclase
MFTDMVGSTAAAQTDEAKALQLRDEQASLVRPLFAAHQGREIKSMGDGFLAEFDSALRAVQCAIDIQQHVHERNSQPGTAPLQLRIGVHLGDVEPREADIFGDAVNIASRIEPEAEPGGVCVSGAVHEQVRNKITDRFEKLPPKALKGLKVPIDLYRIILPWSGRESPPENPGPTGIAVLPFTNISPDPNDEYFADGLTEEVIAVLSKLRGLRVISRTSVMLYKSTPKPATQIGTELDVVSILEGSVRKAGDRIRVTAQLIDARSDRHLWAETYDRTLDDIFAVQAELAKQVAEALKLELRPPEEARLGTRPSIRPASYLAYLKGQTLLHSLTRASIEAAKAQFELAISLDDRNAAAYAGLSDAIHLIGIWYTDRPADASQRDWVRTSRGLAERAIELDPDLAEAHVSLALFLQDDLMFAAAEKEFKLALSLNPNFSRGRLAYALSLEEEGRGDDALVELSLAEAADPLWPAVLNAIALLLVWIEQLDDAVVKIQKLGEVAPDGQEYHAALSQYYLARSDLPSALKEIQRVEDLETEPRRKAVIRAEYLALSGKPEEAKALLRQQEALPEPGLLATYIAQVYAELGDLDDCFHWIEKGIHSGGLAFQQLRLDHRFAHVRKDPRFEEVLKKLNLA